MRRRGGYCVRTENISGGNRVLTAANGKEAIAFVCRESVQLIIMDVMMPIMDGITAMKHIRGHCNLPIILLTAKSEDNDKVLGLTVCADDYVTKPFNPLELMARIRSQLRRCTQLGSIAGQPSVLSDSCPSAPSRRTSVHTPFFCTAMHSV